MEEDGGHHGHPRHHGDGGDHVRIRNRSYSYSFVAFRARPALPGGHDLLPRRLLNCPRRARKTGGPGPADFPFGLDHPDKARKNMLRLSH